MKRTGREGGGRVHVDFGHPSNQKLKFSFVKHVDEVLRNEFAKASHERLKLFVDAFGDTIFHDRVHVVLLVFLRHRNIRSSRLQLDGNHFAKAFFGGSKRLVNDVCDVIIPVMKIRLRVWDTTNRNHAQHPRQTTVEFGVYALQVCDHNLLLEDHFVERDDKVCIQEPTMEDPQTEAPPDELEVVQMLGVDTRGRVDLEGIVVVGGVFE